MRTAKLVTCPLLVLALCGEPGAGQSSTDALQRDFLNPPAAARPRVWWHWMNGNITQEGIRRDLEWMKRTGIGGFQNFDASLMTPAVVEKRLPYMSPEWKEAFRYAATLAGQLGLEMAIASSPGWSETGGPWVKPEQALKKLVWSALPVAGGARFNGTLPHPPTVTGPFQGVPYREDLAFGPSKEPPQYYSDAVVIAYRVPSGAPHAGRAPAVTSPSGAVDLAALNDGDLVKGIKVPVGTSGGWLRYEYPSPRTVYAVTLGRAAAGMFFQGAPVIYRFESSEDGQNFKTLAEIPTTRVPQVTAAFAPVSARFFRLWIENGPAPERFGGFEPAPGADPGFFGAMAAAARPKDSVEVTELVLHTSPRIHRFEEKAGFGLVPDYYAINSPAMDSKMAIAPDGVVDLTARMKADGSLEWDPPPGEWMILRFGYSLTGKTNHPATAEATGLEVDKLDRQAVQSYIDTYLNSYFEILGPQLMGRRGVSALLTDSIEVGPYNWTPDLLAQFKRLRGYDATPFLPALTGVVVGGTAQSDAFLWDFRRTLAELTAQSHYGQIAQSAHQRGLTYYGESLEGTRVSIGDDMEMRRNADIPMAAMWTYPPSKGPRPSHVIDILGAASVAHVYGQNLVAAESLTSAMAPWGFSPRALKPIIDLEFALGVNRPVIHTSVHQPLEKKPGLGLLIFGQYFNRHETWAEMAGPWVTYLARNAHMLQQGKFAADVAYFYGEEAPLAGLFGEGGTQPKDLPVGHGFDFVNSDVVLHQLSVSDGLLQTPGGGSYRLLYLGGSSSKMTLPVLRKIRDLVNAGAVVAGERPTGSPSLAGNASEFNAIADSLWSKPQPKGKVLRGLDANRALASLGVARDFDCGDETLANSVMFVHRRMDGGDAYFVSNRTERPLDLRASFRVHGRRAELWHADTGLIEPASYAMSGARTSVPLSLRPNESVFVVFRQPASDQAATIKARTESPLGTLDGAWTLRFTPGWGAPEQIVLNHLASWTEHPEPGVKYYSGVATYSKTIDIPAAWLQGGQRLSLDLGDVRELAEVTINGQSLGAVWHPPYRLDITGAVKPGANTLEIKVANLWVNRLIGDQQPGAKKYTFTVMPTYKADAPLLPSGLLGPVTISRVN
ncbi:MAG: hypothetical protein IT161_12005 [Bryobacterales bacterium]|nr:hypothetical protein [Bryobacterales bacterium]